MDSMSTVETVTPDGNSVMKAINVLFLVAIGVTTSERQDFTGGKGGDGWKASGEEDCKEV